jgi:hypothetical protein
VSCAGVADLPALKWWELDRSGDDNQDHWLTDEGARIQMLKAAVAFVAKNNPPD